jgi:TRAP-type C4-dicarboxylate transport system substrate-binding protein
MSQTATPRTGMSRRQVLAGASALPLLGIVPRRADEAEFSYKAATGQDPSHPVNTRAQEAIDRIRAATNIRLGIRLFPANRLGSDTDLLCQVRSGAVEFFIQASSVQPTLVPAVAIGSTGFAFNVYDEVWKAVDSSLGKYVRAQIEKVGLLTKARPSDQGFRQNAMYGKHTHGPEDLRGLKMSLPSAPMLATLFTSLGVSPTPINFNEVYSALQTKLVEGQESPLAIISTAREHEVQKYCTLVNHIWDRCWILGSRKAVERLPKDIQHIVYRESDRAAGGARRYAGAAQVVARRPAGQGLAHHRRRPQGVQVRAGQDYLLGPARQVRRGCLEAVGRAHVRAGLNRLR